MLRRLGTDRKLQPLTSSGSFLQAAGLQDGISNSGVFSVGLVVLTQ